MRTRGDHWDITYERSDVLLVGSEPVGGFYGCGQCVCRACR